MGGSATVDAAGARARPPRRVLDLARVIVMTNPPLAIALAVAAVISGLLLPAFMVASGALVAAVTAGHDTVIPLAVVAAIFVLQRVLDPFVTEMSTLIAARVDARLSERLMTAMSTPPGLAHLEDPAIADFLTQAHGDIHDITAGQAAPGLIAVTTTAVQALGSLAVVARWSWAMAALLAVANAGGYAATRWHWRQVTLVLYGRTQDLRRAYYTRWLGLGVQAAKETRVFGLSRWLVDRHRDTWLAVMRTVWQRRHEGWLLAGALVALLAAADITVLAILATGATGGRVGVAAAVAVAQAVMALAGAAQYSDSQWALGEAGSAYGRVRTLEAAIPGPAAVTVGARSATGLPRSSIRLENVTFAYPGRDEPVLHGLDLDICAGRSLAIVGENGAGKTTLVKLLARLYDPTAGRVSVDGIDLRSISAHLWQRRIAGVFQDHVHYELTAFDNVAFGSVDTIGAGDAPAAATEAARLSGALPLIEGLPSGWETTLSRGYTGGTQLSGGEWQRLALARALLAARAGAGLLILDEPTASLDVRAETEVYERFLEMTRGITTIVISHRFSTVRRADRIVVIEHGRVTEDGSHAELIAARGGYAHMYRLQAARFAERADA